MKFIIKALAIAATFASLGAAHADDAATLATAGSVPLFGGASLSNLSGSATFTSSGAFISAMNSLGVVASADTPASLTTGTEPNSANVISQSAQTPLSQIGLQLGNGGVGISSASSSGGVSYYAEDDGYTSSGGLLSISNLKIDFGAQKVYATLDGANGVGHLDNFYLWDVTAVTGTNYFAYKAGAQTLSSSSSGLVLNAQAFDVLSTALGLRNVGQDYLSSVTDFGVISADIALDVVPPLSGEWPAPVSGVPESSTWALVLIGLMGIGLAKRRQQR